MARRDEEIRKRYLFFLDAAMGLASNTVRDLDNGRGLYHLNEKILYDGMSNRLEYQISEC